MNLALFDFDGTVTVSDTFTTFLRFSATPGRLVVGSALLSPIGVAYKLGRIPATTARQSYARIAFLGRSMERLRALGRAYAADTLPTVVRGEALERIAWHQRQGDDVVIVSASLDVYLRPWCEQQRVDLICTELGERRGICTGRYIEGDCTGSEKTRRILSRYQPACYRTIYAYGDSSEDRDMLRLAHKKYFRGREIL